jgi:hypothetical protein
VVYRDRSIRQRVKEAHLAEMVPASGAWRNRTGETPGSPRAGPCRAVGAHRVGTRIERLSWQ